MSNRLQLAVAGDRAKASSGDFLQLAASLTANDSNVLDDFVTTLEGLCSRTTITCWTHAFARFLTFAVHKEFVQKDWHKQLCSRPSIPAGAFAVELKRCGLAAATIDKEWGALSVALRLLGVSLPKATLDDVFHQVVPAGQAPPSEAVLGVPVLQLMLAVMHLPTHTPVEHRNRLRVALAITFGA